MTTLIPDDALENVSCVLWNYNATGNVHLWKCKHAQCAAYEKMSVAADSNHNLNPEDFSHWLVNFTRNIPSPNTKTGSQL